MSTTFEVYPTIDVIPSFRDVIALATERLEQFYNSYELLFTTNLSFDLCNKQHKSRETAEDFQLINDKESYIWFYIEGLNGGTAAYFKMVNDIDIDCWNEEIRLREPSRRWAKELQKSLKMGHYWMFRRSMGQPAEINLSYGYLASAIAELTNGLIFSDDSAWDYERFPCTPSEFYNFYFKPEQAISDDNKQWASKCIKKIRSKQEFRRE